MKKKFKKIALISSLVLGVGMGVSITYGGHVAYAESPSEQTKVEEKYQKTEVDKILGEFSETKKIGNKVLYRPTIQKINTQEATMISLNDPIFDKEDGYVSISHMNFFLKDNFKKGDKIKITYSVYDPIKQINLNSDKTENRKKIMLTTMKNTQFLFLNDEELYIANPDNVEMKINEDGDRAYYIFEFTVPEDSTYLSGNYSPTILGMRNEITRDSAPFNKIEKELEAKEVVLVGETDVKIENDKGIPLSEPFSLMRIKATKDNVITAKNNNNLYASLGFLTRFNLNDLTPFIPESDKQSVNANVLNGGITGGIVSTDVEKDLSVEDIDFGELHIGQKIDPIEKDSMISVRDWTGGSGWKLTAQHKNSDRNQSLQLGVQVNEKAKVNLNNDAQLVTSGESQLNTINEDGNYFAEWGTHPTVGNFNNVIEWNLTANVTE